MRREDLVVVVRRQVAGGVAHGHGLLGAHHRRHAGRPPPRGGCRQRPALRQLRQQRLGRHHPGHGRGTAGVRVDHFAAGHRARGDRHRPPGAGRAASRCTVGGDPGLRRDHRQAALGVGHGPARA
ncbi:hypothetical protein G6F24_016555 [Rhizopus arrhizus]|nr:hypothetical protein G6F24_016555 [Rhizopus arrhizus]